MIEPLEKPTTREGWYDGDNGEGVYQVKDLSIYLDDLYDKINEVIDHLNQEKR